ncbi:MAG: HAMP domain-containing protein [Saprospiraceae bacterium]|nr:HAMP domain-containing protein [Saprospiraceae bacterium]
MKVQTRLTLRFGIIVASVLMLFSIGVYLFAERYRAIEFYERIERRARFSFKLNLLQNEVNKDIEDVIGHRLNSVLVDEQILVFDKDDKLIYSNVEKPTLAYNAAFLDEIRLQEKLAKSIGEVQMVGFVHEIGEQAYVILASGHDEFGFSKLQNLRYTLIVSFLISVALILFLGFIYAKQALEPLRKLMNQIAEIYDGNLSLRVDEGKRSDEFEQLAMQFNQMLIRLQAAFDTQKNFVASASHELRTPLAAIRSQLQVTLSKDRTPEEYRSTLQSLFEDTEAFIRLTTGLLQLAQSDVETQRQLFQPCRIDEALFSAQEELLRLRPSFRIHLKFDEAMSDDETELTVLGSEALLSTAFQNLMENGCKFSPDHTIHISVAHQNGQLSIGFKDNGIGIPAEEQSSIFNPFHRASNAIGYANGHGIGLSICQKIVQLHSGSISLQSNIGHGSLFIVHLTTIA